MNRIMRLGGALMCVASLSACATITRGTRQAFVIETDPPGANVRLSSGQTCVTPCALRLKRRPGFTASITREGYEPVEATVASGVSGGGGAAMAGNVILGGIIGGVVDATNGSMNNLEPNPLRVNMVRLGESPASSAAPAEAAAPTEAAPPADAPATAEAAPAEAPEADDPQPEPQAE